MLSSAVEKLSSKVKNVGRNVGAVHNHILSTVGLANQAQRETMRDTMRKLPKTMTGLSLSPPVSQGKQQNTSGGTSPPKSLHKVIVASNTAVTEHYMLYMDVAHATHCPLTHM